MGQICIWKRLLIYGCLVVIILAGCLAQTEKGFEPVLCQWSSQAAMLRQLKLPAQPVSDVLDDVHWIGGDDASAIFHLNAKKTLVVGRGIVWLSLLPGLLTIMLMLFVAVRAGSFFDSSSQTGVLTRLVSFVMAQDGEKGSACPLIE